MNVIAIRRQTDEMSTPPPETGGELGTISLKWIFSFLVRRIALVGGIAAVVFVVCLTVLLMQPSQYTATSLIMINPGQERVLNQDQMVAGDAGAPNSQLVDSQLEVLRSKMMAGRLVDDLRLVDSPDWNPALRPEGGVANAAPTVVTPANEQIRQEIVDAVSSSISVSRRGLTYLAEVEVTSGKPEQAAEMANRLIALFQDYQMTSRVQGAERANSWLSARVVELREDVQQKEAAVERYRAQSGLLATPNGLLSDQQTIDMQASLMQARADLAEKEARYEQVLRLTNEGGSTEAIASVLNSAVIAQMRGQEAEVARRQADLESRYNDTHPAVVNVRAERQDIHDQINAEISRILASLRNEVDVSRVRVSTLQSSMAALRGQMVGNNEQLVALRELEREATASRSVYESFLQRYHQIADQGTLRSASAEVVTPAVVPTIRSSPRLSIALVLSLGLGLALGLGAGLLAEALEEGINEYDEVERKLGVPALANLPKVSRRELAQLPALMRHPAQYLLERPVSAFAEAFRVLRTTILFVAGEPRTQVVAVCSALPNEGKTTVSLSLARVSALSGQRVLLVDCDLRRRCLKDVLGIEPPHGLMQVLSGEITWRQAIYEDEPSGMHVLPLSESGFTPRDVFGVDDMDSLLAELRDSYDLIILDCAPVLAIAETRVVAAKADCAIVVSRWQKTPVRAIRSTIRQLQDAGVNVRGVALNAAERQMRGYYAYGGYGYYKV